MNPIATCSCEANAFFCLPGKWQQNLFLQASSLVVRWENNREIRGPITANPQDLLVFFSQAISVIDVKYYLMISSSHKNILQ